ncbi:RluA family pseudouridine synthase [Caldimonas brevitalea]|uniref:Pseudouridine synthase n=1 Tax=Caldimonas brevitalea TaxID=413882 RepID=A0A0G3BLV4_9BURK|nr:RluA family pseudouridine synthase [Caldimonas brevitalea]AKJ28973.1 pseudouridine synthase [Caldimonas brevitalea]
MHRLAHPGADATEGPTAVPNGLAELEDEAPELSEFERRQAVVSAEQHGQRLDKVLVSLAGEFSRSHLQSLIEQGLVELDGRQATTASRKVLAGQRVVVELRPTPQSQAFRPESIALSVVFEDEHLMVVDKPAGLVVHPAAGNWSGTLLNGLLAHHAGAAALPRAGIVHRLDKDTSGLMVVGKTLEAVTALVRAIAAREVHREYLALAHGEVLQPERLAVIDAPIGRDPQTRVRMAVVPGGKTARTDVEVLARGQGCTALRCRLHTGRTHQIRVHLASRGFPLVADVLYGGRAALDLERQALHAARLGLTHPVSGQPLSFEAPLPGDLAQAWQRVTEPPM